MGAFRLLLAVVVMLYHNIVHIGDRESGVTAVVAFYLLSGYVMTALVDRYYTDNIRGFYFDRAMRLLPQYLFYLVLSQALISIFHPDSIFIGDLTPLRALLSLTMVGLNLGAWVKHASIIPQAWSLGLECQFYLIFPFVLRYRTAAFLLSLAFALLTISGWPDPSLWLYRMIPGALCIFLFGSLLRRSENRILLPAAYACVALAFIAACLDKNLQGGLRFEVLFGLVAGIPVVFWLSKVRLGRFDELLGNLSYGVFLNHFFLMWVLQIVGIDKSQPIYFPILVASSLVLAFISFELVEKPIIRMRRSMRNPKPAVPTYQTSADELR